MLTTNNYKMNLAKFHAPSPSGKSRSNKSPIRSSAFRRKFQDGMPRINQKAIPFHYLYEVQMPQKQKQQANDLNFWGCIMPKRKNFKIKHRSANTSQYKRNKQTRGETMFKKYIKRRPSLTITSRTYQQEPISSQKNYETVSEMKTYRAEEFHLNPELKTIQTAREKTRVRAAISEDIMLTSDEVVTMNRKSLYQMSPQELKASIQWKKKFIQLFDKKMLEAKKGQNKNFQV